MPFGNSDSESQRDSGSKPRVARNKLPWENGTKTGNPNGSGVRGFRDRCPGVSLRSTPAYFWQPSGLAPTGRINGRFDAGRNHLFAMIRVGREGRVCKIYFRGRLSPEDQAPRVNT